MIIPFIVAVLPTIVLGYMVYKKDILEKEPISLLITLFIFGLLSTLPCCLLESLVKPFLPPFYESMMGAFIVAFFGVAIIEESYKALFTYIIAWRDKNFNHVYDGIVYAVFTSLGFATLENILYVTDFGIKTAILRALVSVPAHAFFGVTMGYYMGIAKYNSKHQNSKGKKRNMVLSIVLPIIFHGIFDFLLLTNNEIMVIIFFVFVALLYVLSYFKVQKLSEVPTMLPSDE